MKTIRLFTAILAFFPWLSACANARPPKPPLIFPFAVQRAGSKIETELRIVEKRLYTIKLLFMFKDGDQEDYARVRKLAGDSAIDKSRKLVDPGIPILLRLKIIQIDAQGQKLLFEKESSEQPCYATGTGRISKRIEDIKLDVGHYKISVENLKDVPELEGTKINFVITFAYTGK